MVCDLYSQLSNKLCTVIFPNLLLLHDSGAVRLMLSMSGHAWISSITLVEN